MKLIKEDSSRKSQVLIEVFRVVIVVITAIVYSLAVEIFLEPAKLVSLGLTSVGQIFGEVVSINAPDAPTFFKSPGFYVLVLNIPLLVWGFKSLSPKFVIYTCLSIAVQTIFMAGWIDGNVILDWFKITDLSDNGTRLFLAIIAALLCGVSIGVALRYGTSTGGLDIVAQIINFKKGLSIGMFEMMINVVLAIVNGLIINDMAAALFTFIFIIVYSLTVDKVHTSYNFVKIDIITKNKEAVTQALIDGIKRGCTSFDVEGQYTHERKADVYMVISSYELDKAKRIIYEMDPEAFVMVTPIKRVFGRFFKHTIA